jgi:hypothetical protein
VLAVLNNVFSQKTMFERKKQCLTGKNIRKIHWSVFEQTGACASGSVSGTAGFRKNTAVQERRELTTEVA